MGSIKMARFVVTSALVCLGITNIQAQVAIFQRYPDWFVPDFSRPAYCDGLLESHTIHPSAVGKTDNADFIFVDESSDPIVLSRECYFEGREKPCNLTKILEGHNSLVERLMEKGVDRWDSRQDRPLTKVFHVVSYNEKYRIQTTTPGNFVPFTSENYKPEGESRLADMITCLLSEYQDGKMKMWVDHGMADFGWDVCHTNQVKLGMTMRWMKNNLNWPFDD